MLTGEHDVSLSAEVEQLGLVQVGVTFDLSAVPISSDSPTRSEANLIDGRLDAGHLENVANLFRVKVRKADVANLSGAMHILHALVGFAVIDVRHQNFTLVVSGKGDIALLAATNFESSFV